MCQWLPGWGNVGGGGLGGERINFNRSLNQHVARDSEIYYFTFKYRYTLIYLFIFCSCILEQYVQVCRCLHTYRCTRTCLMFLCTVHIRRLHVRVRCFHYLHLRFVFFFVFMYVYLNIYIRARVHAVFMFLFL